MATSQEDLQKTESAFADAFNEDAPARPEQTEDEAFGLGLELEAAADGPGNDAAGDPAQGLAEGAADGADVGAVVIVADGDELKSAAEKETAKVTAAEASESQSQENADEPTDPKDIQRKKSWEGRLRAEEARLKGVAEDLAAKAAGAGKTEADVAGDALEEVADQAQADGDATMAEKVGEVAEMVEDGEMSAEDAMKSLAEDFGEPFVKMIAAIAKSAATETASAEIGALKKSTEDIIDHLRSTNEKSHFKTIYDAHPDFVEISKEPDFEAWRDADPERARIVSGGSAEEVIDLLSQWKAEAAGGEAPADGGVVAQAPAADQGPDPVTDDVASDDDIDAAEGVRSAGMQLPQEPAAADDFAGAWDEFEAMDRKKA